MAFSSNSRDIRKVGMDQERYNRHFDRLLQKNTESIQPCDNIFLQIERKDENEIQNRLAPITEDPFPVLRVNKASKTVLIKGPV